MRVQVYYNLHKHLWSVKNKKTGLVIDHCEEIYLQNCKFIVREGGRQRVIKEQKKNVHAFIEGDITDSSMFQEDGEVEVTYNPYKHKGFVLKQAPTIKVLSINSCKLKDRRVFI